MRHRDPPRRVALMFTAAALLAGCEHAPLAGPTAPDEPAQSASANAPVPDWGGDTTEGRLLWFRPGTASIWRMLPNGARDLYTSPSYRMFNQSSDWEAVGVAQHKVLWQRSDGTLSLWTMNDQLNLVRYDMNYGVPAGYRATSIAVFTGDAALSQAPPWGPTNPPRPCFPPNGTDRYWILFRDVQQGGVRQALVWTVDTNGSLLKQEYLEAHPDRYTPTYFGPDARGRIRLLWTAPSGPGEAHLWTLNRTLHGEYHPIFGIRFVERWQRAPDGTWISTINSSRRANGFSPVVIAGFPTNRFMWAHEGRGSVWLQRHHPDNVQDRAWPYYDDDHEPLDDWTGQAYTDIRQVCPS